MKEPETPIEIGTILYRMYGKKLDDERLLWEARGKAVTKIDSHGFFFADRTGASMNCLDRHYFRTALEAELDFSAHHPIARVSNCRKRKTT